MEIQKLPIVEISLSLSGKKFEHTIVSSKLGIDPVETRTIDDWPKAIKDNVKLPEYLKPRCIWSYSLFKNNCNNINIVLNELMDIFYEKEDIIKELRMAYDLSVSIEVVIHAQTSSQPYIGLNKEAISFLFKLDTEIGFAIYAY